MQTLRPSIQFLTPELRDSILAEARTLLQTLGVDVHHEPEAFGLPLASDTRTAQRIHPFVERTLDELRDRFGTTAVKRGSDLD